MRGEKVNILLTNDDGYEAEGFRELKHVLEAEGHFVIACSTTKNASGCGSGRDLSLLWEVEVHEDGKTPIFAIRTDRTVNCIDFGKFYFETLGKDIDMVLVGINHGPNFTWTDLYNSGTMGAGAYAVHKKYTSIALSEINGHYRYFPELAKFVVEKIYQFDVPEGTLLSINFPDCKPDEFKEDFAVLPSNLDGGWHRYFETHLDGNVMYVKVLPVRVRSIAEEFLSQNKAVVQFLKVPYE